MKLITVSLCAFILMLMLGVVAASPFFTYTDKHSDVSSVKQQASSNDEKKLATEEEVKAYLVEKLSEKLDLSTIMNYLEMMSSSKKKGNDKDLTDVQCIPNITAPSVVDDVRITLNKQSLTTILDTLHPINGGPRPFRTILALNYGKNVYTSELSELTVYASMISDLRSGNVTTDGHLWVNYSPCRLCTAALIEYFKVNKPTIHVARINTEVDKLSDVIEAVQCLAALEYREFTITPWNFDSYKTYLSGLSADESCINEIGTYVSNSTFMHASMQLIDDMMFVHQLRSSQHACTWCGQTCEHDDHP